MDLAVETQIKNRKSFKDIFRKVGFGFWSVRPARRFQNRANAVGLMEWVEPVVTRVLLFMTPARLYKCPRL